MKIHLELFETRFPKHYIVHLSESPGNLSNVLTGPYAHISNCDKIVFVYNKPDLDLLRLLYDIENITSVDLPIENV